MVPEPTEAMVNRLAEWFDRVPNDRERYASDALTDLFAAAPPEWLLRAALTEEELGALLEVRAGTNAELRLRQGAVAKLSRALRGGEAPDA